MSCYNNSTQVFHYPTSLVAGIRRCVPLGMVRARPQHPPYVLILGALPPPSPPPPTPKVCVCVYTHSPPPQQVYNVIFIRLARVKQRCNSHEMHSCSQRAPALCCASSLAACSKAISLFQEGSSFARAVRKARAGRQVAPTWCVRC